MNVLIFDFCHRHLSKWKSILSIQADTNVCISYFTWYCWNISWYPIFNLLCGEGSLTRLDGRSCSSPDSSTGKTWWVGVCGVPVFQDPRRGFYCRKKWNFVDILISFPCDPSLWRESNFVQIELKSRVIILE